MSRTSGLVLAAVVLAGLAWTQQARANTQCASCLNGATCRVIVNQDGSETTSCICAAGFTGAQCQNNTDDCINSNCQNGATCVDGANTYTCECKPGYSGSKCATDIDDCNPPTGNPCRNGGTCIDGVNDFTCKCKEGYSGERCVILLDSTKLRSSSVVIKISWAALTAAALFFAV